MPNVPFAITDGSLTFLGTREMTRPRKWSGKDRGAGKSRNGANRKQEKAAKLQRVTENYHKRGDKKCGFDRFV